MKKLVAVVAADGRGTQALLAAEALRKAAAGLGVSLEVESRAGGTSSAPLAAASIASADGVVIVGDGDA
ncbi:MAG: PTS fructose transporter subunit EIIBC, partial [Phyllobacteriaceae bacterium]|nr:PTS fructose transporter subunit EIIBC [Phyllobacteriaceae bacterium]